MERIAIYYTDDDLKENVTYADCDHRIDSLTFYLGQNVTITKICKETLQIIKQEDVTELNKKFIDRWSEKFIKIQFDDGSVRHFKDEQKAIDYYKSLGKTTAILSNFKLNVSNQEFWNYNYYYFNEEDRLKEYQRNQKLYFDNQDIKQILSLLI